MGFNPDFCSMYSNVPQFMFLTSAWAARIVLTGSPCGPQKFRTHRIPGRAAADELLANQRSGGTDILRRPFLKGPFIA
jgi:hypothetical protein